MTFQEAWEAARTALYAGTIDAATFQRRCKALLSVQQGVWMRDRLIRWGRINEIAHRYRWWVA